MKDAIMDATGSEVRKVRVKPKVLKSSAMDAGLAALAALESAEVMPRPVVMTARTLVEEGIESILKSRAKGIPLIRIYTDLKRATRMTIGYQTFAGYVSEISRKKGLRPAKDKAEAEPAARPMPEPKPVPTLVGTSTAVEEGASTAAERAAATAAEIGGSAWGCSKCEKESTRTEKDGKAWWKCPGCGAFWTDEGGKITPKRLNAKAPGAAPAPAQVQGVAS